MTGFIIMVDPRRISQRLFGGPHFAVFERAGEHRIKCVDNGDVFDTRGIGDAWMESRDLAPILRGGNA